jgi:hypothetical protein
MDLKVLRASENTVSPKTKGYMGRSKLITRKISDESSSTTNSKPILHRSIYFNFSLRFGLVFLLLGVTSVML